MHSRIIGEMAYLALAMAAVAGLALAALSNCDFAASFFTLVLLAEAVLYTLLGLVFFLVASVGNDGYARKLTRCWLTLRIASLHAMRLNPSSCLNHACALCTRSPTHYGHCLLHDAYSACAHVASSRFR